ncbi:hypothetical protein EXN32_22140 [Agrobacterium tumefaciens]|nr:hypothetical protein EXN32_22140 [Agrobacterium tumefaciens]
MRRRNDFVSTSQAEFRASRILLGDYALPAGLGSNDLLLHVTNRPARQPNERFFICVRMPYSHSKLTKPKERV